MSKMTIGHYLNNTFIDLYKQEFLLQEAPHKIGTIAAGQINAYTTNESAYPEEKFVRVEIKDSNRKDLYVSRKDCDMIQAKVREATENWMCNGYDGRLVLEVGGSEDE